MPYSTDDVAVMQQIESTEQRSLAFEKSESLKYQAYARMSLIVLITTILCFLAWMAQSFIPVNVSYFILAIICMIGIAWVTILLLDSRQRDPNDFTKYVTNNSAYASSASSPSTTTRKDVSPMSFDALKSSLYSEILSSTGPYLDNMASGLKYFIYDGTYTTIPSAGSKAYPGSGTDESTSFSCSGSPYCIVNGLNNFSQSTQGSNLNDKSNNYSIVWTGYYLIPKQGSWNFSISATDTVYLWLGTTPLPSPVDEDPFAHNTRLLLLTVNSSNKEGVFTETTTQSLNPGFYPIQIMMARNASPPTTSPSFRFRGWMTGGTIGTFYHYSSNETTKDVPVGVLGLNYTMYSVPNPSTTKTQLALEYAKYISTDSVFLNSGTTGAMLGSIGDAFPSASFYASGQDAMCVICAGYFTPNVDSSQWTFSVSCDKDAFLYLWISSDATTAATSSSAPPTSTSIAINSTKDSLTKQTTKGVLTKKSYPVYLYYSIPSSFTITTFQIRSYRTNSTGTMTSGVTSYYEGFWTNQPLLF